MDKDSTQQEFNSKVLHKSFDFKDITWTIPNVLSLPHIVGYDKVKSSSFPFANANWELVMYPCGMIKQREGYIDLVIRRLNSEIPEHFVFFKFCLITCTGSEFKSCSNSSLFNLKSKAWAIKSYLEKSELLKRIDSLAPNGDLTINCQMRTKKVAGIERASQTESTAFLSDPVMKSDFSMSLIGNKILSDLKQLFLKQEDHDVIVKVKGKDFPAHRAILVARSPVFASTFRNDMTEKATGIVNIEDCDPSSFSDFLCFLYCGHIENLLIANVFSLFTTADKYDVQDLRSECMDFMKKSLSIETFCDTISLALQHSEKELIELSITFFAGNLQEIIKTVKWQSLLLDNPIQCNELIIKALSLKN